MSVAPGSDIGTSAGGRSITSAKAAFFDSEIVIRAMDAATRKALSKAGAFVRTSARSMIKKAPGMDPKTGQVKRGRRKKGAVVVDATALPGAPPYGHGDQKLKNLIFFSWDPSTKTVVIGPALFQNRRGAGPKFLEYGGVATLRTNRGKSRPAHYRGNPVMHPAMEKGLGELLQSFENSM